MIGWAPKLKPGNQPGEDCIGERKEPLSLDRLTARLAIGGLAFIGVTSAVLGILWDGPKRGISFKVDSAQPKPPHIQQSAVDAGSKSGDPGSPARSTSGDLSSMASQGVVLTGVLGSIDQTPPPTAKPTLRGVGAESDASEGRHLRATRRHREAPSAQTKKRHRRADSSFAAVGHALRLRIVQWLEKL